MQRASSDNVAAAGGNFIQRYVNWVQNNPQQATDFETGCKWIYYIGAGKVINRLCIS